MIVYDKEARVESVFSCQLTYDTTIESGNIHSADYFGTASFVLNAVVADVEGNTFDVHLEESDSGSGDWTDIAGDHNFTQVLADTTSTQKLLVDMGICKAHIRAVAVAVEGETTFSLTVLGLASSVGDQTPTPLTVEQHWRIASGELISVVVE